MGSPPALLGGTCSAGPGEVRDSTSHECFACRSAAAAFAPLGFCAARLAADPHAWRPGAKVGGGRHDQAETRAWAGT